MEEKLNLTMEWDKTFPKSEEAHSCYFSRDAFAKLTGDNKELMIIPSAEKIFLSGKTSLSIFAAIFRIRAVFISATVP